MVKSGVGIFHFHSRHSWDSCLTVEDIFKFIVKHSLNFAVLTDHDTLDGVYELQELLEQHGVECEVPFAVEYSTDSGDLIVIGPKHKLSFSSAAELFNIVKSLSGVVIVPHPSISPNMPQDILNKCDAIEVYNGRLDSTKNIISSSLSLHLNCSKIYGSDAHIYKRLGDVFLIKPVQLNFSDAILQNKLLPFRVSSSFRKIDLLWSTFIGLKTRFGAKGFLMFLEKICKKVGNLF